MHSNDEKEKSNNSLNLYTAIELSNFKETAKALNTLPKTTDIDTKDRPDEYLNRRTDLYFALTSAITVCRDKGTNESWKIMLFISQEFNRDFPLALKNYIERNVRNKESYCLLSYENVPESISSLPEFNPLNALWKSIFCIHEKYFKERNYEVPSHFLFLAKELRRMGWGREIKFELLGFERHLKTIPEIRPALSAFKHPDHKMKHVLSQLTKALKDGANEEFNTISTLIETESRLPTVLGHMVCGYMGLSIFAPQKEEIPLKKPRLIAFPFFTRKEKKLPLKTIGFTSLSPSAPQEEDFPSKNNSCTIL